MNLPAIEADDALLDLLKDLTSLTEAMLRWDIMLDSKPRRAIHFANGDVLVFNILGDKIPELCGHWEDVHGRVVEASDEKTHFEWVDGAGERHEQTAESW